MIELTKEEVTEILEQLGKLPCSEVWQLVQHLATKLVAEPESSILVE